MELDEASNGFGRMLPHRIFKADESGLPTNELVEIRRIRDLEENATEANFVLPPVEWPTTTTLPNGD